jgi:competence protein ComEA
MERNAEIVDDRGTPGEMTGLLWSLAVAAALGVLLACLASRFGGAPARGATVAVDAAPVFVAIQGTTGEPAIYRMKQGATLRALFAVARFQAGPAVNVDRPCKSGEMITVRPDGSIAVGRMDGRKLVALGIRIPLNDATVADLAAIPGIGDALAARIVEARMVKGAFKEWSDVRDVPGVGEQVASLLVRHAAL